MLPSTCYAKSPAIEWQITKVGKRLKELEGCEFLPVLCCLTVDRLIQALYQRKCILDLQ